MSAPVRTRACQCGAVEVEFEDGVTNHMGKETFDRLYPGMPMTDPRLYHNCDHCVNHWGIDLCGCGSGEPVGACCGEFQQCDDHTASETLGAVTKRALWAR